MNWVWNDYDRKIHETSICNTSPNEPYFGISRKDGSLKPAGKELKGFKQFTDSIDIMQWDLLKNEVSVLMPESYFDRLDFFWPSIYHSYMMARSAGLHVNYLWVDDFKPDGRTTLFIPCLENYTLRTWHRIVDHVKKGGTVYCSFAGFGQLGAAMNELFGVEVEGVSTVHSDIETVPVDERYGMLTDSRLPDPGERPILITRPKKAKTLIRMKNSTPLLLRHRFGKGSAYLLTYPLEYMLARQPQDVFKRSVCGRLYRHIACGKKDNAGFTNTNPAVEIGVFRKGREYLLILINHDDSAQLAPVIARTAPKEVRCIDRTTLRSRRGNQMTFSLPPCGIAKAVITL